VPPREVTVKEKIKPERMERISSFEFRPAPLFEMIKQKRYSRTFSSTANDLWRQKEGGGVGEMPGLPRQRSALPAGPIRVRKDWSVIFDSN
jgi:hypothetical protein